MTAKTYVDCFRLDGRDRYYLWQSDMEAGSFETPIVQHRGQLAVFGAEQAAREHAGGLGLPIADKAPFLHDLDAIGAWCDTPTLAALDYATMACGAGLLDELGVLGFDVGAAPGEPDGPAAHLYDKLFMGLAAIDNPAAAALKPLWVSGELDTLARLLARGLTALRQRL